MNKKFLIFLFLLICFGFAAFAATKQRNQTQSQLTISVTPSVATSPMPSQAPESTGAIGRGGGLATRQISVVDNFYNAYTDCMKNPPVAAAGKVTEYCISHNEFGSTTLPQNLEEGGIAKAGADPVICAQNPPESIKSVSSTDKEGGLTEVTVQELYGAGKPQEITVDVQEENGDLKVINVHCPNP